MEFRPCIDLHGGKVKQIVGETLTSPTAHGVVENFVSEYDSTYYAQMFERDGLRGGHVIMLGGGNEQAALEALRAYPGGLQIGGGITADNALHYLDNGASHVIVTSYIFHDGMLDLPRLQNLVQLVGKERLVIDLSCKQKDGRWYVVTNQWKTFSNFELTKQNLRDLEHYCDEFLVHAVDVEGKRTGILTSLVELLADSVTIPTTYAGGARSLEDLELFDQLTQGKMGITIGSALDIFGGNLSYDKVVARCKR